MRQAEPGFLPLHAFAFTPIARLGLALHGGHHAAVDFGDEGFVGCKLLWQALGGAMTALVYLFGVRQCGAANRALGDDNPVVLDELVHDLGEGQISAKVGDDALQARRAHPGTYPRALREGAQPFAARAVLRLDHADETNGGVPVEFFLPSRCTQP